MLTQGWTRLVALLDADAAEENALAQLQRLCTLCVAATGTSGAALVIASDAHRSTVWATDTVAERLEELQLTFSEGPGVDAFEQGRTVQVPNLSDGRWNGWPIFSPAALAAGARALFALPLRIGHIRAGALSLYRSDPGEMDRLQRLEAGLYAEAAALLLSADRGQHGQEAFRWAVDDCTRFQPQVHRAVGALTVQLSLTASDAFARLRAHAILTDAPIGEVAEEIVTGRLRLEHDSRPL